MFDNQAAIECGKGWKRYGIRNTHERGDARWGGDARTPGYPGGQRANLLTILANLRAAHLITPPPVWAV